MSKVKKVLTFSPLKELSKGKSLDPVLKNNPVVAMPDEVEIKKKKLRELSRTRAAMSGSLGTNLSKPV